MVAILWAAKPRAMRSDITNQCQCVKQAYSISTMLMLLSLSNALCFLVVSFIVLRIACCVFPMLLSGEFYANLYVFLAKSVYLGDIDGCVNCCLSIS